MLSDSFFLDSGVSIGVESNLTSELSRIADQDCSTDLQDFERTKDFVNSLCHQPPPMLANLTDLSQSCAAFSIVQELTTEAHATTSFCRPLRHRIISHLLFGGP